MYGQKVIYTVQIPPCVTHKIDGQCDCYHPHSTLDLEQLCGKWTGRNQWKPLKKIKIV